MRCLDECAVHYPGNTSLQLHTQCRLCSLAVHSHRICRLLTVPSALLPLGFPAKVRRRTQSHAIHCRTWWSRPYDASRVVR